MPRRNPHDAVALAVLADLVAEQAWVCTRQQALAAGLSSEAVRRRVGSGRWVVMHRGVYATRCVEPDLVARMWAAHLAVGPSSVVGAEAAGHYWGLLDGGLPADRPVTMLVPEDRRRDRPGIRTRRVADPTAWAHPARTPPVLSVEHAVLDLVAGAASDGPAVDAVMRACRLRLTTPARLLAAAEGPARLRRRRLLTSLCAQVAEGITSPLEARYAAVARAHGLPRGWCQAPATTVGGRSAYRDVEYPEHGVVVELDGRLGHEDESSVLRDQFRDNAATLTGAATLRFGWSAVGGCPCEVAAQVATLLRMRGWTGRPRACGAGCAVVP